MSILLALGMLGGLAKGIASANSRNAEYQDKLEELNRSQEQLDQQYSQAKDSYSLSVDQAKDSLADTNKELGLLANETLANRDLAIKQTAKSGGMQSQLDAAQIATLAVQNEQSVGAANQQAATSGFRGTGTAKNVMENTQRSADDAIAQARMQSDLSKYQTYASAVNTYTDANQRVASYQRQIEQNQTDSDRQLEALQLQMEQTTDSYNLQGGYLASDLEYLQTKGKSAMQFGATMDLFGGLFSGASAGANLASYF